MTLGLIIKEFSV